MVSNVRPSVSVYQNMTATVCLVFRSVYLMPSSYSESSVWKVSSDLRRRSGTMGCSSHSESILSKSCS